MPWGIYLDQLRYKYAKLTLENWEYNIENKGKLLAFTFLFFPSKL